ncbi:flavoprotein [Kalaharituber pfeilii]|nr:flavoprotein [Kalaharituber pfeilii]
MDIPEPSDTPQPLPPPPSTAASTCSVPFLASSLPKTKTHLLLACTGSIATIKLPDILSSFIPYSHVLSIHVILTPSSLHFLPANLTTPTPGTAIPSTYPTLVQRCWTDADEWSQWTRIGDPVLHIELRKWADILLIAPLSADFLAKMVGGHVEGLLGGVVRAWDTSKKIVVAPAMNTLMWEHPITEEHMGVLGGRWSSWIKVLEPVEKRLACGDMGRGGMKEWRDIVEYLVEELALEAGDKERDEIKKEGRDKPDEVMKWW